MVIAHQVDQVDQVDQVANKPLILSKYKTKPILLSLIFTSFFLSYACDSAENSLNGPCGTGSTQIEIGKARPFIGVSDSGKLMMEYGLQGGYHVDVSLRIIGAYNPDHVDVALQLNLGEINIGQHLSEGWYLLYGPNGEKACYFYNARIFLHNEKSEIPSRADIEGWVGKKARLKVALTHSNGYDQKEEDFILDFNAP